MPESSSKARWLWCKSSPAATSTTGLGALLPRRIAWMLRGAREPQWVLEAMPSAATPTVESMEQFAVGKRVWTRYAPTARARAAICVQRFDDSLNPAIHITYRVSRRSSSLHEPRDPSLKGGCWIFEFVCSKAIGGCGFE